MNRVAVIDYGMGNLHSVAKAVEYVGRDLGGKLQVSVTAEARLIAAADRVIFPGVGAIRDCMAEIHRLNVGQIIKEVIKNKPLLAICVGMQALMERSEENEGIDCLGLMRGQVRFFGEDLIGEGQSKLKVPHMGWNRVSQTRDHPLWKDVADNSRFYFVHSYYIESAENSKVASTTTYGKKIVSALADENIFAAQFHPEKSQMVGLTLLRNFLRWDGQS
ncbi:MAG: imidazole glycerol phosphate synthase subunit HisH [Gammaproteobacteria bacterium]|nr:imidazole glycerol phosphate synthase subunit HisH [Gammaproteobacteria bacterium]